MHRLESWRTKRDLQFTIIWRWFFHAGAYPLGDLGAGGPWPPTSISEPKKIQQFHFKVSGMLLFIGVQKLYRLEYSWFWPWMLQLLDNSRWLFILFYPHKGNRLLHLGPPKKVRYQHLTLDSLKCFSLWTIRKRNKRDYRRKPGPKKKSLKQEKHPYKGSTIKYNTINNGPSQNILWSIRSIQMWCTSISKYWKTGFVIKTGPTGEFLWNKRSTLISGPQLNIKNHIMAYRRAFGKDPLELEKILW